MDKSKFTRDPHLDSEGFIMLDAPCRGCAPDEMCPRSGHCERYDSPLRYEPWRLGEVYGMGFPYTGISHHRIVHSPNPPGWQEVEGVTLPPVDSWADEAGPDYTDEEQAERTEIKKRLAEMWLNGTFNIVPAATNEEIDREINEVLREHGVMPKTEPDPKCAACSPWAKLEQRDLDTVHQLWLAERITPQGGF